MPKNNKKPPSPARPSTPPTAEAAFAKVSEEVAALPAEEIVTVNVDIPQSVSIAMGALPRIQEYADQLKALPGFDPRNIDNLEDYTLAAWFTHIQVLPGVTKTQLALLLAEGAALRARLLGDADALVRRGLFDGQAVASIRSGQGHLDLANDLVAISAMFVQAADAIAGRTLATQEEIARAGRLGPELIAALGVRGTGGTTPTEAADRRVRAYTLFVRAYGEVRRGLIYLRWHDGDVDEIAPSLYRGRGGRTSSPSVEEPEVETEEGLPEKAPEDKPVVSEPTGGDGDRAPLIPPPAAPSLSNGAGIA